jgi:hypothetical protein
VLAKRFEMANFKAVLLQHRNENSHFVEFAIGKDVALNEITLDSRSDIRAHRSCQSSGQRFCSPEEVVTLRVSRATDGVIEQPALVREQRIEVTDVFLHTLAAHMFKHADRTDGIKGPIVHIAVVLHTNVDSIGKTSVCNAPAGKVGLFFRESDANSVDTVVLRRMHHHRTPTATDIKKPHAGGEVELPAHKIKFRKLRLFKCVVV